MKHGVFISYSDFDKDKVDIIVNELTGNESLYPIVIASDRQALKLLTQKVAEGIIKADIIVPILTKSSISTQWINQEIGFASALEKKIMPIIEAEIIDSLKGFIHKQIDLPYNFKNGITKDDTDSNFRIQIKNLISDLELVYKSELRVIPEQKKSQYDLMLEETDRINEELEFKRKRKEFIHSPDGVQASKNEVLDIITDIQQKIEPLKKKNFHFGMDTATYEPEIILRCEGFSFSIAWDMQFTDKLDGPFIYVKYWKGNLTSDPNVFHHPSTKPEMLADTIYYFDRSKENEVVWLSNRDQKHYLSKEIVDTCLAWIVGMVSKQRLDKA